MKTYEGSRIKLISEASNNGSILRFYYHPSVFSYNFIESMKITIYDKPIIRGGKLTKVKNIVMLADDLKESSLPINVTKEGFQDLLDHVFDRKYIRQYYGRAIESKFLKILADEKTAFLKKIADNSPDDIGIVRFTKNAKEYLLLADLKNNDVIGLTTIKGKETNILTLEDWLGIIKTKALDIISKSKFHVTANFEIDDILGLHGIQNTRIFHEELSSLLYITRYIENALKNQKNGSVDSVICGLRFEKSEIRHKVRVSLASRVNYGV